MVLNKEFPNSNLMLIKYALGGSSLYDWSPQWSKEKAEITGHPEYGRMFETFVQKIDSITENYETEIVSLLWMQGERDVRVPEAADDYYENFTAFINAIRRRTSSQDLTVIYGLINPDPRVYTAVATVQDAQKRVATEFDNVYLIETHDLAKWDDKVHYSTQGQLDLGSKFGKKITELLEATEQ